METQQLLAQLSYEINDHFFVVCVFPVAHTQKISIPMQMRRKRERNTSGITSPSRDRYTEDGKGHMEQR